LGRLNTSPLNSGRGALVLDRVRLLGGPSASPPARLLRLGTMLLYRMDVPTVPVIQDRVWVDLAAAFYIMLCDIILQLALSSLHFTVVLFGSFLFILYKTLSSSRHYSIEERS
jgi:hypothetical protein